MKRFVFILIVLFAIVAIILFWPKSPIAKEAFKWQTNDAVGGQTEVESSGTKYKLNYDLKATIESAKSVEWDCNCIINDSLIIVNEEYTIFGDCKSQNGNQLIRRGRSYYLISKKLIATKIDDTQSKIAD